MSNTKSKSYISPSFPLLLTRRTLSAAKFQSCIGCFAIFLVVGVTALLGSAISEQNVLFLLLAENTAAQVHPPTISMSPSVKKELTLTQEMVDWHATHTTIPTKLITSTNNQLHSIRNNTEISAKNRSKRVSTKLWSNSELGAMLNAKLS